MVRLLVAGAMLGALALALSCHSKSYSDSNGDGDDAGDDGDDDGGLCICLVGGTEAIPCGDEGCVGGQVYQCTPTGTALPTDESCGDASATDAADENCVTTCSGQYCNVSDGCGGICKCAAGITCNGDGTCGNGCHLTAGDFCSNDAGTGASDGGESTCCSTGYDCLVHDSGVGTCCVIIGGGGTCSQSSDCCDYPAAKCVFPDASPGQCTIQ